MCLRPSVLRCWRALLLQLCVLPFCNLFPRSTYIRRRLIPYYDSDPLHKHQIYIRPIFHIYSHFLLDLFVDFLLTADRYPYISITHDTRYMKKPKTAAAPRSLVLTTRNTAYELRSTGTRYDEWYPCCCCSLFRTVWKCTLLAYTGIE